MRLGPILLFLFIAIPIAEIWILISVGGILGVAPTVALVVLTAVAGTALIRHQGIGILTEAQTRLNRGEPPVGVVIDGAFLLVAGALLLTPGFLTDAIGFLCLVGVFRRAVAAWLWAHYGDRIDIHQSGFQQAGPGQRRPQTEDQEKGTIIEGEFFEVDPTDDGDQTPDKTSPWNNGS